MIVYRILTVAAIVGSGETEAEADINTSADEEELEHEVVEGFDEEHAKRCSHGRVFLIRSKLFHSFLQVSGYETRLEVCLELFNHHFHTYS